MRERDPLVLRFETAVQKDEPMSAVREQTPTYQPISTAELTINSAFAEPPASVAKSKPWQLNDGDRQGLQNGFA